MNRDLECPYCGEWNEVCHDDGQGYEEGIAHEATCAFCEKSFVFYTEISYHYESKKAGCLNGEAHDYRAGYTYPVEFTKMGCTMCGKEREPTKEEWEEIKAPPF